MFSYSESRGDVFLRPRPRVACGRMTTKRQRPLRSPATTKLAIRRKACGVSREDLARAVGTSTSTLGRLERGGWREFPFWLLNNCARALGVDVTALIED